MGKNTNLFRGIGKRVSEQPETSPKAVEGGDQPDNQLGKRVGQARELVRDETVHKTLRKVDPSRCRMWAHHNRRYDLLNETNCSDLIEGIKSQHGQEFPAVVRRVTDDPEFDFEVICGARRHWTITYLHQNHYDYKFLIEIRDINDEEAFRLSDIENRDRKDICEYERALDYNMALEEFYNGNRSRMAARLEVALDWLSRFLDMAELPDEVVGAYPDVSHIKVNHARVLKPFLIAKDKSAQQIHARLLQRAGELRVEQTQAREQGREGRDGRAVFRALKSVTEGQSKAKGILTTYDAKGSRKPMMEVKRQGRSGLTIRIIPGSGADKAEVLEACKAALNEYLA